MRTLRVLLDTSVIGGCLDREFSTESCRVVDLIASGRMIMLLSDVTARELILAPPAVRMVLDPIKRGQIEEVHMSPEAFALRDAYLAAHILSSRWHDDALQVALATVARADAIVSWNFRHIVRLDKIRAFNQVNLAQGFGIMTIISPKEIGFTDE